MKKTLLLGAVALCAVSLSAQISDEVRSVVRPDQYSLTGAAKASGVIESKAVDGVNRDIHAPQVLNAKREVNLVQAAEGTTDGKQLILAPYYRLPFSFHQALTFGSGENAENVCFTMFPYNTDMTLNSVFSCRHSGYTNQDELQNDVNAAAQVATYSWKYINSQVNDSATSTARDLTLSYTPLYNLYASIDVPTLSVKSGDLAGEYTSDNSFFLGGTFQWASSAGVKQFSVYPFDCAIYTNGGYCGGFGIGDDKPFSDSNDTWTSYHQEVLTEIVKNIEFPNYASIIDTVLVTGFAQWLPKPLTAYALSSMAITMAVRAEAGASFKITVSTIADDNSRTVIGEKTVTCENAIAQPIVQDFDMTFSSKNAYGETLNYVMVDSQVIIEITDIKGFTRLTPAVFGYPSSSRGRSLESYYMAYSLCNVMGSDGKPMLEDYMVPLGRYFRWGLAEIYYNTMAAEFGIEYPYLWASRSYNFATSSWDKVEGQNLNLALTSSDSQALFEFKTSATKDGQIEITMEDGDFLPDWLIAEAKVAVEQEGTTYVSYGQIAFEIDEKELNGVNPADWKGNIVATYKNQKVLIKVNGGTSGVSNIEADAVNGAVVSSEYFDLQGRRLNAEPENGVFIIKNIYENGKSAAQKVVK